MSVRLNNWAGGEPDVWERIEDAAFADDVPTLGGVLSMACEWRRGSALRQVLCDVGLGLVAGFCAWGLVDFGLYVTTVLGGGR